MTPGVKLSTRTSAAPDMWGAPNAATEPPPGSVCRERSVCPGGTSNQAMWCLILRADRAMEDSYFSRSRSRLIGQCEVAVRSLCQVGRLHGSHCSPVVIKRLLLYRYGDGMTRAAHLRDGRP